MKLTKWISLFLIAMLTVTMIGGCKKADVEESASADSWVERKDEAQTNTEETTEQGMDDQKPEEKEDSLNREEESAKDPNSSSKDPMDEADDDWEEKEKPAPVPKESSGTEITFLSQNIFHVDEDWGEDGTGIGNRLSNRLFRFKSMVKANDPDVIFINEARGPTISFFQNDPYFAQNYTLIWKYRWEGKLGGDQAEPILFKKAKYTLLDSGFFWLSETPDRPSKSYDSDADYGDISSWVQLKDKTTGSEFFAYCTHFSPSGTDVKILGMRQYLEICRAMDEDAYAFIGGDFNNYYRQGMYKGMMEWDAVIDLRDMAMNMKADGLCELGGMSSGHNLAYGNKEPMPAVNTKKPQIDYVMAKLNPHMAVDYYGFDYTIYDHPEEGVAKGHISDHWGLVVKVRIDTDADYSQYQCEHDYGDNPIYF